MTDIRAAPGFVSRRAPVPEPTEGFMVLVLDAGLSGPFAAIKLQNAGITYTVVEKDSEVGGTW